MAMSSSDLDPPERGQTSLFPADLLSADEETPFPVSRPLSPTEPKIAGWGRIPVPGVEKRSEDLDRLTKDVVLTRGLGRSYGDASLPPPTHRVVAATPLADRIRHFDPKTGVLRAEAGLSLRQINEIFLPRRFASPVLPGTQYITLGGMVAADVHGKEHHFSGCFGEHVRWLKMRVASGAIMECTPDQNSELFFATLGGMGLTGHILEVEFVMKAIDSPWIWQETLKVRNIDEYIDALKDAGPKWPYIVGWIDCLSQGDSLGRGILMCGRWAKSSEAPSTPPPLKRRLAIPMEFPSWALNRPFVKAFNFLYYGKHFGRSQQGIVHPESFFHPLDSVHHWNRIYGKRGFTQYQCVLPDSAGRGAARGFLEFLTQKGGASFLCVIKDCGPEGRGMLSFPTSGISIALDIAVRENTQSLVDALNERVIDCGGRVYLAKDSFTRHQHFLAMEPRLEAWMKVRKHWDPESRIRSAQSVRLLGDPE